MMRLLSVHRFDTNGKYLYKLDRNTNSVSLILCNKPKNLAEITLKRLNLEKNILEELEKISE